MGEGLKVVLMLFLLDSDHFHRPMDQRTDRPTDRRTDGPSDRRTDKPSYRDAWTHVKLKNIKTVSFIDLILNNFLIEEENLKVVL